MHHDSHDFMFQLTQEEVRNLKSQFVISSLEDLKYQHDIKARSQIATASGRKHGGVRKLPYAFTEHGIAMLSSVLKSERAVQMNILIVRAFVRLREMIASHKDLAVRVEKLETKQSRHNSIINVLAEEIRALKIVPEKPKRRIGFKLGDE